MSVSQGSIGRVRVRVRAGQRPNVGQHTNPERITDLIHQCHHKGDLREWNCGLWSVRLSIRRWPVLLLVQHQLHLLRPNRQQWNGDTYSAEGPRRSERFVVGSGHPSHK